MRTVRLKGLELTLVRDAQGVGNWQVKAPQAQATTGKNRPTLLRNQYHNRLPEKAPQPTTGDSSTLMIDIASVNVSGLLISYDNQLTGQKYTVSQASLTTGAIAQNRAFPFELKAHIAIPELAMNALINGDMTFDLEAGNYDIKNLKVSAAPDVANGESLSHRR